MYRVRGLTLNIPWLLWQESCWQELHCSFLNSPTANTAEEGTLAEEYSKMPPRCCAPLSTGNKLRWMHWSPNKDWSIRHPHFAQGYPKSRRLLTITSPVEAGDIRSLSHPPKVLRLYLDFVELLKPQHSREGMSTCHSSSRSKIWYSLDDVAGS